MEMEITILTRLMKRAVLLSFAVLVLGWLPLSVNAEDQLVEGAMILAPVGDRGGLASGAVEDTLDACLARIPDKSTDGQRRLAEQSCEGEEAMRQSVPFAPKF